MATAAAGGGKLRKKDCNPTRGPGSRGTIDNDKDHFSCVGQLHLKFMTSSDEPSPGSGPGFGDGGMKMCNYTHFARVLCQSSSVIISTKYNRS